jgi:signal transduction histidine kinase
MMRQGSLRFRLTAWYAAALTAALAVFGGLTWLSLRQRLMNDVDEELAGRASRFIQFFRTESAESSSEEQFRDELEEFCQALPAGSSVNVSSAGFTFEYVAGPSTKPADIRTLRDSFEASGRTYTLEVGVSVAEVLHTLELLKLLLVGLLPVVVVIACVGGAWLAKRALKPVEDIINAARAIGIENLSERLPVPQTGDELSRLTEVLNTMFERLESSVKTLSQFVADASHELRTPLTVLRTTAELALRRSRSAESYRESLEEIAVEAARMTMLVENLLEVARSDAGFHELPGELLSVSEVVQDVASELQPLAEMNQIRIRFEHSEIPSFVFGNRPSLHRLFLVLLDNAVKFSAPGGEVILKVERSNRRVVASIRDFGVGIPAADLPHIFRRFYQADPARTKRGHGLGLSLAEGIARAHGALIDVESTEGFGSVFRVTFPSPDSRFDTPAAISADRAS